ncbi:thioredoxin-like domain-containing protein [Pseudomassariella vexata]|uniref:Protein disulfide-isomerase n=1 Tax=Pseudomassariella vexata TaxID=1141098 RepID=A0A1Y2DC46_9PEZI|nr:thioredoxin-like domain-containing protein [Pseudomassariella vexata]ORY56842.1 thioredoxin-like domain-domain-containing protein [Pseudomassariella vexata]
MRGLLTTTIIAAASTVARCWEYVDEPDFLRAVSDHNPVLVAFVEPSTASSQALESEWTSVAKSEKALVTVDCSTKTQLCKDYEVISYPALRYLDGHGKMISYRGPRTASSIISFLRRAARPAVTPLNAKKITAFQSIDDTVIVAHINPKDEHIKTQFQTIARALKDRASFGSLETTGASSVVCYSNQDDEQSVISDLTAIESLDMFIRGCMTPLIGEFTRRSELKYLQAGKSIVYYFATDLQRQNSYVNMMRPVAKKYREYLSFVTVDANEYGDMALALGIPAESFPAISVQNPMYGQVFPLDTAAEITPETIEALVLEIASGKRSPWDGTSSSPGMGHSHDEL